MNSPTLLTYRLAPAVRAFSTTRTSPFPLSKEELEEMGSYAAFNVTHYCGDTPERVQRNREWLCAKLCITPNALWLPHQTHTARVRCIDTNFLHLTPQEQANSLEETDALITDIPGQCIGISTADCIPVLLYDAPHHALAAIHAGWRGTAKRIVQAALREMATHFGTEGENVRAVLGPGISPQAFEVGEEVADAFLEAGFPKFVIRRDLGLKPHIDLPAANAWLLEKEGVPPENIEACGICTYARSETFFSARRLGIRSGRIFTGIMLRP